MAPPGGIRRLPHPESYLGGAERNARLGGDGAPEPRSDPAGGQSLASPRHLPKINATPGGGWVSSGIAPRGAVPPSPGWAAASDPGKGNDPAGVAPTPKTRDKRASGHRAEGQFHAAEVVAQPHRRMAGEAIDTSAHGAAIPQRRPEGEWGLETRQDADDGERRAGERARGERLALHTAREGGDEQGGSVNDGQALGHEGEGQGGDGGEDLERGEDAD